MITFKENPDDGRSKTVWITTAGHELRDQTLAALAPGIAQLMAQTDTATLLETLRPLRSLRVLLDENRE